MALSVFISSLLKPLIIEKYNSEDEKYVDFIID